jgi:hypothetical protein
MAPFDLAPYAGLVRYALLFGAIGFGFGFVLEMAGFGDTRKLAAQFFLADMTVLKVMFTGIAVASLLIALASSFGVLDLHRVWVNPTYLWPEIVGGLVMGVGFVIGGFCPGTSVVAAATLKVDGMLFLLGALLGVFAFGETVSSFEPFWLSSYMGRATLPEWLGVPMGVVVLGVVLVALAVFWVAERVEVRFGGVPAPRHRARVPAAIAFVALAVVLVAHGQPTPEQRWARAAPALRAEVGERAIFASPAEVVSLRKDTSLLVAILDLRDDHDYNLFHVGGSQRIAASDARGGPLVTRLLGQPAGTVTFLVGNGEDAALRAWQALAAQGVTNLYVVEGGINRWLELYPAPACVAEPLAPALPDALAYRFAYATGSRLPAAWPELPSSRSFRSPCPPPAAPDRHAEAGGHEGIVWPLHPFTPRVKLQVRSAVKGGCG